MNNNSSMEKEYRIIRADSAQFFAFRDGEAIKCRARSKLKKQSVVVGDVVFLDSSADEPVIDAVAPRKNILIRPLVANVDQIIIIVASVPEIDYLLVDKLIINAIKQDIEPIICLNKTDLQSDTLAKIKAEYQKTGIKIIAISAKEGNLSQLKELLKDKLTLLAGQSAVGKSSIVNVLIGDDNQKTGELSKKISRGKNTTTSAEIFAAHEGYIVDTPGFSMVDIFDILPEGISSYYTEFDEYRKDCKFSTCLHLGEPQCMVREAAARGDISEGRYLRYKRLYQEGKDYYDRNPKQKTKSTKQHI